MASQQNKLSTEGTGVATTDGTTWTTVCSLTIPANCVFMVSGDVLGKDSSGNVVSAKGQRPGRRVSGVTSLVASLIDLVSILLGSDAVLSTSSYRINVSGDDIQLQVKGVALTTITWDGKLFLWLN